MELMAPRAKLNWAVEKLEALDAESKAFLESQPLYVAPDFDEESGCHILRLRAEAQPQPMLRLGLMVGDVVHNARSALDQAAWLLACRSTPVEKLWEPATARKIAFPVTRDPERFKTHSIRRFLAEDAIAVLEGLQPYQGGNIPDCLGHLDLLWNIDKHRVIHSLNINLNMSGVSFRHASLLMEEYLIRNPPETTWAPPLERVEDGAEVARVRFHEGAGPPLTKVKVEGQPSCEIAFGSGDFCFPVDALGGLLHAASHALADVEALPDVAPS